jgi:hypothetical protein
MTNVTIRTTSSDSAKLLSNRCSGKSLSFTGATTSISTSSTLIRLIFIIFLVVIILKTLQRYE